MRLNDFLNKLFAGCGIEDRKLELQGILYQISEEYHSGNITDEELTKLAVDLCQSITVLARYCNKNYPQDKCVEDITNLIKTQVPSSIIRAMSKKLSKMRSRKTGTSGIGGLL